MHRKQFVGYVGATVLAASWIGLANATSVPSATGLMVHNFALFGYTGTVTAPNGTAYTVPGFVSTPNSTSYPGRDAAVLLTHNAPIADAGAGTTDTVRFATNWFASTDGKEDGANNPNNTNVGFVQLFDTDSSGVTHISGGWTNRSLTTFTLEITGQNGGTGDGHLSRLWDAPQMNGSTEDTGGVFGPYRLQLAATFAPGAASQESPRWYSTQAAPVSLTGSFTGSFTNTGPATPGPYSFNLTFDDVSWAGANDLTPGSYFGGTVTAVPEPSVFGMFGAGLLVLGGFVAFDRRRKAQGRT